MNITINAEKTTRMTFLEFQKEVNFRDIEKTVFNDPDGYCIDDGKGIKFWVPLSQVEETKEVTYEEAIRVISKRLNEDTELRKNFRDTIALTCKDQWKIRTKALRKSYTSAADMHVIANKAASNFLNILTNSDIKMEFTRSDEK